MSTRRIGLRRAGPRDYRFDPQGRVIGFGDDRFAVQVISRTLAVDTIRRRHYSGTIVNNSYVHLGVFWDDQMVGVAQWGYALNPARAGRIVAGTGNRDYLELNRLWLDDRVPRNGESMALACSIRYIRRALPGVQWLQSFADERCGCLGVIYQAANFLYCGRHRSPFLYLDGQWYHKLLLTAHRKGNGRGRYLRENQDRAQLHWFWQYRYLFFLRSAARRRLLLPVLPYPKPLLTASQDAPEEMAGR